MIKKFENVLNEMEIEQKKLEKCKALFLEVFDDSIKPYGTSISGSYTKDSYSIYFSVSRHMTKKSYKDYNRLFVFLNDNADDYIFSLGNIKILFDNIDDFIRELEIINVANKYNI